MMNIRDKSINIDRNTLLFALRTNLAAHAEEYTQALIDYRIHIIEKLMHATKLAQVGDPAKIASVTVQFNPPQDHRKDYMDAIEMLEYSTDEKINLDQQSFKAYVKNEWHWTQTFKAMAESYKSL